MFRLQRACLRRWSATDPLGSSSLARILDNAPEDIVWGQIAAKCIQALSSGLGHFFRHVEFEKDDDIATPAPALPWKAAFTDFDGLTRIGVRGDLDDQRFPVEVFEFNGRAQQEVGISERQGHDEVGACSFKPRVRLNFDLNEQITRLARALRLSLIHI